MQNFNEFLLLVLFLKLVKILKK